MRRPSRRLRLRPSLLRLALAGTALVFATTSIARQDALSLIDGRDGRDGRSRGEGAFLVVEPLGGLDVVSLEAADLFGAGHGPGFALSARGAGDNLVLMERADPAPDPAALDPFVDRTTKGDLQPIHAVKPFQLDAAPRRAAPDALATLPALGDLMRPDRRGALATLPQMGDVARTVPSDGALAFDLPSPEPAKAPSKAAEAAPQEGALADSAYADAAASEEAAVTRLAMTPRESGANHDGSTPSVLYLAGGRMPVTTTPTAETPLAVAALPVAPHQAGATPATGAVTQVAFTPATDAAPGGATTALRGDIEGAGRIETRLSRRLFIPEDQLPRAEQCLAEAIYFEARGEPVTGQYAVAQVVMNRVRSGYYPDTICGVVYQNKHRRNACQFSFACDRIPDRVNNARAWEIAERVARDVTQGGAWLPEVGDATHYHATYVRPRWIRDMVKLDAIGLHIFYRVRWHTPPEDAA
ncbi:cell wall hydrolase [Methylopila turkensis]|uniref:Cell wall hydrolase SleB domain-containing protein n=1 Tax=Methylopila turkensis TaxID=1437816 RepID=A0A9W6JPK2_9HYPH|nr:cell wall hydrolase [Methylopila turkensis]GLK80058.1 hypothetical protein GCM10008174_17990 [Methylopila turkensis]